MAATRAFVRAAWGSFIANNGHDTQCLRNLRILDATPGVVKAVLVVESIHLNRLKTLHGGLLGTAVDSVGSLAVGSKGLWFTGVSTDIHTTFVRSAREGEEILITGKVVGFGASLLCEQR